MIWFAARMSEEKLRYAAANCESAGSMLIDRRLRLGRQIVAHLVHFRADVGERLVRVVVQLQMRRDRGEALRALRFAVVDAVGGGDGALERRGDEAAHQIGVRADVERS